MKQRYGEELKAAALAYEHGDYAPRVIARGHGPVAEAIIARAREAGVYVHESAELVNLLMQVDQDSFIPPELYRAVAELLVWLHALDLGLVTSDELPFDRNCEDD